VLVVRHRVCRRYRFAIVEVAEQVDSVHAIATLRFACVDFVVLIIRYGIHHVGPLGGRVCLQGEVVQSLVHAGQLVINTHIHADRRHHVVLRCIGIVIENP